MAKFHVIPRDAVPPDPAKKRAVYAAYRVTPEKLLASLLLLGADFAPAPAPSEVQEILRKRRAEMKAADSANPQA